MFGVSQPVFRPKKKYWSCGMQRFKSTGQWDNATRVLIGAGHHSEAVDLCLNHAVDLTEDLAERMTPEKGSVDEAQRISLLRKIAKAARKQGKFQLAAKKYTQVRAKETEIVLSNLNITYFRCFRPINFGLMCYARFIYRLPCTMITSVAVLAEISVSSPRKLFILII